ncbi:SAM-dependent methyltransferase [Pelagibacteraceae bacterium]|jgi:NADH dehydrogenase [ubiquinone] 1 alpha subcomplex assembly factor 7|nr:SAM-dependent methyltransferase [Pelagibacteraceae bacterium]MDC1158133.1 SAM-dependent methyltransferase [Pelagibacteraceae bacterium]
MKSNSKFFKNKKLLPVDEFFQNVLYDREIGYYSKKHPFGKKGDFITAPKISNLFSEMIAIWIISAWQNLGKPKHLNIIELGPGDGTLTKILLEVFKKFPDFNSAKKIYLYEISNFLKKVQKKKIQDSCVKWIKNFKYINDGPVIFFGNEFFDAMPIKQFKYEKSIFLEKNFQINKKRKIETVFKNASKIDIKNIKSYSCLNKLKFIEFPKYGLVQLKKIVKKILKLKGCLLLIDYGYVKPSNKNTLQSIMKHKYNYLLNNLGHADITSHVNFELLKEFFLKNNLKVKKIVSQQKFLKNMGILNRADIISKKMKFRDQSNMYLRLKRLLSSKLMGELFKVTLAYKAKSNKFFGFN